MTYIVLEPIEHDTPEWHERRTQFIGASETAAVLGVSKWQTPVTVYRSKMGVPNEIPENLAYFGHVLEEPIAQWIRDKHPEVGEVLDGFWAQSVEYPWLSATPDRTTRDGDTIIPIELKTSSAYSRKEWESGVPDYYRIQVMQQLGVLGAPYGWLAVLHGGNEPGLYRIDFDPELWDVMVRFTGDFWTNHVQARVMPAPVVESDIVLAYPTEPGTVAELSEAAFEVLERRTVLLSDIQAMQEEAEALKVALAGYVGAAETLTYEGRPVATWKMQSGRRSVDMGRLLADFPDVAAQVIKQGEPFKTLRRLKEKGDGA